MPAKFQIRCDKGPFIKDVRIKLRKIDPLVRLYTINFEKSEVFCSKKCGRPHLRNSLLPCPKNVRTKQIPLPLTADVFHGQLLIVRISR